MPNDFFHFKQFTVYHNRCAMKVGTDGVLLGAWANVAGATSILDVGSGSGLIALMMAQRTDAEIHALEIDLPACEQAQENINASRWKSRISLIHDRYQDFARTTRQKFDLVISNPPFFSNSLKPQGKERTDARHDEQLPHSELVHCTSKILSGTGRLAVVIPYDSLTAITASAASESMYCIRKTYARSNAASPRIRALLEFAKKPGTTNESDIIIYSSQGIYSDEYKNLTRDFYLKF